MPTFRHFRHADAPISPLETVNSSGANPACYPAATPETAVLLLVLYLAPAELTRRAQEAASVMVRLLAETKLLVAHGDMTAPEAYSLPDGVLRRILSRSVKA